MPDAKVNGITIYYEQHGQGEPLVLIGGLGTDLSEYEPIIRWLANKYQVLAFDNRGAGRTDKPDAPYSIEMMAEDTAGLMQAVGLKQAHIIGTSMGGRIALALALKHPELVKKLVLVSTCPKLPPGRRWMSRLLEVLRAAPLFQSDYPQPRYAYLRQREATTSYDCTDRLPELQMPTVILHGRKDNIAPYPLAEKMHAGIAGSKMVTFKGGHMFFLWRERQQFLEAAAQFLG